MTPKPLTLSEKSGLQLFSEGEEEACVCEAFAAGGSETKQASYELATRMGLEPTTSGVTGRRSNQLNYHAMWFPEKKMVGTTGLEPVTSCV